MPLRLPDDANARVITVAGKRCRLELDDGTRTEALARGRLFESGDSQIVVGDHVRAAQQHDQWTVESVLPREREFVRLGLRNERQVLFANADRVLILASLAQPETKPASIDRFLVAALLCGTPAVLVLTKTDLDPQGVRTSELTELYQEFDAPIFPICSLTGNGLEPLIEHVQTGISALVGNSGVGKTTLLNHLIPDLNLRVREVSTWSGKGTHATTAALLVPYGDQAALIDTPGLKSFVPFGMTRESVGELFPDIVRIAADCRFHDCRHLSEPDCAVHRAVDKGTLSDARLRSYHRLLIEATADRS